jgi:catechol 2,3-dioxygenase-like lactoylglutathione lyase family enzyme
MHRQQSIYQWETTMSRVQLALNVSDLDEAVRFYTKLFATEPAKRRPGYANFAIDEPPLKLVLMEGNGTPGTLNHLGVEVFSTEEVTAATTRLAEQGIAGATEEQVSCCYAVQDKVWVDAPDGEPWEIYTVLADADPEVAEHDDGLCCATAAESEARCC